MRSLSCTELTVISGGCGEMDAPAVTRSRFVPVVDDRIVALANRPMFELSINEFFEVIYVAGALDDHADDAAMLKLFPWYGPYADL